eukprot:1870574-Pleurochrysis_carterae.AAC.1
MDVELPVSVPQNGLYGQKPHAANQLHRALDLLYADLLETGNDGKDEAVCDVTGVYDASEKSSKLAQHMPKHP